MALGNPDAQRRFIDDNKPRVQEKVDEPVLSYGCFYRSGSWGGLAAGKASPIAGVAMGVRGKKKAGGLPKNFILAVTDSRLYAFKYRQGRGYKIKVGDELAVWDRARIRASVEDTKLTRRLTIKSPEEDERVVCDATKAEVTDEFLRALGAEPAAA
jgi:hypothetical protein